MGCWLFSKVKKTEGLILLTKEIIFSLVRASPASETKETFILGLLNKVEEIIFLNKM